MQPASSVLDRGFPALRHPNFRRYVAGLGISSLGNWMQNIALPWLAFDLTHSAFMLGLVGALQFLPALVLSLVAGVWLERRCSLRILRATQGLACLVTTAFAILLIVGLGSYPLVLAFALCIGLLNIFDLTARQSLVIRLVGRQDLMNAVSLNSSIMNVSRIVGPALAALLIAGLGTSFCFAANAASFAVMSAILATIRLAPEERRADRGEHAGIRAELLEGFRYFRSRPDLARGLVATAIIGAFAFNYSVMVPVYARQILGLGSAGYSWLMSAIGVGCLCGALTTAVRSHRGPQPALMRAAALLSGLCFVAAGLASQLWVAAAALACQGFFILVFSTSNNALMQLEVEDAFRGRLSSYYTLFMTGFIPVGSLAAGTAEQYLGGRAGFLLSGAMMVLGFGLLWLWEARGRQAVSIKTY